MLYVHIFVAYSSAGKMCSIKQLPELWSISRFVRCAGQWSERHETRGNFPTSVSCKYVGCHSLGMVLVDVFRISNRLAIGSNGKWQYNTEQRMMTAMNERSERIQLNNNNNTRQIARRMYHFLVELIVYTHYEMSEALSSISLFDKSCGST